MKSSRYDPVESEFIQSWDKVEQFYKNDYDSHLKFIVLRFIASLRRAGYDRKLHAGQSMYCLVLSRSRRAGLSPKRPLVSFEFHAVVMDVFSIDETGHEENASGIPIALFGPVKKALEKLSTQPLS